MLSLADRVAYQRAIEEVYWRHRLWPKENAGAKPPLDKVMSQAQIEKKVEDYLRNSQALEDYWQRPITSEQLQAEMERMVSHTKQPEVLRELFEALGNDPFVIAECLARPALTERLLTNWYAYDQRIHGELRQRAEVDLKTHPTVKQMKQLSGEYTEIELVKSDSSDDEANREPAHGLKLNSHDWDETVQKLAAMFGNGEPVMAGVPPAQPRRLSGLRPQKLAQSGTASSAKAASTTEIKTGVLSPLQEDEDRYYATAVTQRTKDRLKVATIEWRKQPLESWRTRAENQMPKMMAATSNGYTLPAISEDLAGCTDNTWAASSMNAPRGRFRHTAVWTGSEMIVWGGYEFGTGVLFDTGGRYNPITDTWTAISNNNAPPRTNHTAVWTGSEMIVWGGFGDYLLNSGGRYNPNTNIWTATSTTNAPSHRQGHTAVWTGTQMIVWGGSDGSVGGFANTGGIYNPYSNTWATTSTANAPQARYHHTAVWTGGLMIVWGGNGGPTYSDNLNTGGRYSPATNTWAATSTVNAPEGRWFHRAVWTGSEMIVWGGDRANLEQQLNTGGRYNPATNSWSPTSITNAPTHRDTHTAVWTGSEMIVWGGWVGNGDTNTGGRYRPGTNSWTAINTNNAPSARESHTAIWTGTEMIVWGGGGNGFDGLSTGGRYNPTTNTWLTTNGNAPTARSGFTAVWTGSEMIVWGGSDWSGSDASGYVNTGARYNPSTDSWTATTTTGAPARRDYHTAVWTGTKMIIWGGHFYDVNDHFLNTGGRYDPATNSWTATSVTNAPPAREKHTAVWTGSEMIVWGGTITGGSTALNTGGRYNPNTNTWLATGLTNAPSARYRHTAVWSSSEMIVWGGGDQINYFNTGGRYNPISNSWTPTSITNAPWVRQGHTAVWTGSQMIVWGGYLWDGNQQHYLNNGSRYIAGTNSWAATSVANAPTGRDFHTAVWTGSEMIVWGGSVGGLNYFNTGGRYNPNTNGWAATSTTNAPSGRQSHTAVWTGSEMIVWGGGFPFLGGSDTGGRYCAQFGAPPLMYDFNHDNNPDYVLYYESTRRTAIWYLNNHVYSGGAYAPILPVGWSLIDVADFNRDGNNDYALVNPSTRQTAIWYLSGVTRIGGASGPALPSGWSLVATGDFNNDRKPDYVLYNSITRQTAVWYLNNNVYTGGAYGPTLPAGWSLAGLADFNRDGKPDYLLFNLSTYSSVIWYLSGTSRIGSAFGPTITAGYNLTGAADFNSDSKPDYAIYSASTGQTAIWYLNNNLRIGSASGPTLPASWTLLRP
jgi:N-acetylneuraminic acid mutarotase